jgi:uncharacterized protein (TIGR03437 family)
MNRSLVLLIAAMGMVVRVPAADFNTGQAARLVIGQPNFTEGGTSTSDIALGAPSGIALANNQLFVADSNRLGGAPVNNRVLIYSNIAKQFPQPTDYLTNDTAIAQTCLVCVGRANVVLGQADFTKSDLGLSNTAMRTPAAVASDGNILVVADSDNNRVLIWNHIPTSNNVPADVVIGQPDFTHGATLQPPTAKSYRGPQGVWLQNGKLFVADTQNNRVLIYNSVPTANGAAADVVLGQTTFTAYVVPDITKTNVDPTASNLSSPVHVSSDGQHLFVTDLGHNRVLIWNSIPTTNNQAADLVIGQAEMTRQFGNDSASLCPSNGTNTLVTPNVPTYPQRCGATLSFPRAAVSDGKRLFIADGGNDRVLVFSTFPVKNGPTADVVLGQTDPMVNNSSSNADALTTPSSLAWDGSANLYVSDTFNRRIVVYSTGDNSIPLSGIRNSASLEIYAAGRITFGGTVATGDVVTLALGTKTYAYTTVANDTLTIIINKLVGLVNAAPGDPNVIAIPNTVANSIVFTARAGGPAGGGTLYSLTTNTSSAITHNADAAATAINLASATQLGPGSLITIEGTNLSDQTAVADYTGQTATYLPTDLGGVEVYIDGNRAPLLYVSPTQINTQLPFEMQDRASVSVYVRTVRDNGTITATTAEGAQVVRANPGIFAYPGSEPRAGIVYHASASDTALISVDGTITAGNTGTITVGSSTYTYTVLATDTLTSVRDALIAMINANNTQVTASAPNEFNRILLTAKTPGPEVLAPAVTVSISSSATLILTALNSSLCCANTTAGLPVDATNPARPGESLFIYTTGLGVTSPLTGNLTGWIFPNIPYGPATPVDSVLAGGTSANIVSATLVPGLVGVWKVVFQIGSGLTTNPLTQLSIAQQLFVSNVVTFPVATP